MGSEDFTRRISQEIKKDESNHTINYIQEFAKKVYKKIYRQGYRLGYKQGQSFAEVHKLKYRDKKQRTKIRKMQKEIKRLKRCLVDRDG